MPASKKMLNAARLKANREAGIGDENGRVVRVKESAAPIKCVVCSIALKPTKTNSELKAHADKEGKGVEECFPGCTKVMEELKAKVAGKGKGTKGGKGKKAGKATKADAKKAEAEMFAQFGALTTKKKKKKKSKK
jgi:hypothetical protein